VSVTGSNGEPLAKTAAPSVQRYACSAVHSALEVGLESAKMTGRPPSGVRAAMDSSMPTTTFSVKVAGCALTPMSAVGRTAATISASSADGGGVPAPSAASGCA